MEVVTMQLPLQSRAAFAAFVRNQRLTGGMTQDELAQAVGKSRRWVHDLEAEKVDPSLSAAIDVAAALGFSVSLESSERSDVFDALFGDL